MVRRRRARARGGSLLMSRPMDAAALLVDEASMAVVDIIRGLADDVLAKEGGQVDDARRDAMTRRILAQMMTRAREKGIPDPD